MELMYSYKGEAKKFVRRKGNKNSHQVIKLSQNKYVFIIRFKKYVRLEEDCIEIFRNIKKCN